MADSIGDTDNDQASQTILRQIRSGWLDALRACGGTAEHDPFLVTFDPASDLVWVNYATPMRDADDEALRSALPTLHSEFAFRARKLRFEFFEALHPSLGSILCEAGVSPQMRMPAMVCTRAELHETQAPAGLSLEVLDGNASDEQLRAFIETRDAGFGPLSPEPIELQASAMRRELASRAIRSALVRVDGVPAGTGTLMGRGPVCELGGVTTVPAMRGRGVARFVSERLAALHLADRNADAVWLTAGNDLAQRVYDRIGFRVLGWQAVFLHGR